MFHLELEDYLRINNESDSSNFGGMLFSTKKKRSSRAMKGGLLGFGKEINLGFNSQYIAFLSSRY